MDEKISCGFGKTNVKVTTIRYLRVCPQMFTPSPVRGLFIFRLSRTTFWGFILCRFAYLLCISLTVIFFATSFSLYNSLYALHFFSTRIFSKKLMFFKFFNLNLILGLNLVFFYFPLQSFRFCIFSIHTTRSVFLFSCVPVFLFLFDLFYDVFVSVLVCEFT